MKRREMWGNFVVAWSGYCKGETKLLFLRHIKTLSQTYRLYITPSLPVLASVLKIGC
jgi:hypothetical protein